MRQAGDMAREIISKATQSKQFTQQQPGCESSTDSQALDRTIRIWDRMVELYSDKWTRRNGLTPPSLWINAIGKLSDAQIKSGIGECMRQCLVEGNKFAPDLSDFLAYVSSSTKHGLGIDVDEVMQEFNAYCKNRSRYSCAETYPWKHPVFYWICCDLRSEMIQKNLTSGELEKLAKKKLNAWGAKVQAGESIPDPVPLLSEKASSRKRGAPGAGHSAAMEMLKRLRSGKPNTN